MNTGTPDLDAVLARGYQHGFVTDIESDTMPPGLDEDTIRFISAKKREPQFLLDWRLRALARWRTMKEPHWAKLDYKPIGLPGHFLFLRAEGPHRCAEEPVGSRSETPSHLREAGRSAA